MTPWTTEDRDATGVSVMHPSADKSCLWQRLSFAHRGVGPPCRFRKNSPPAGKCGVFTVWHPSRQPRSRGFWPVFPGRSEHLVFRPPAGWFARQPKSRTTEVVHSVVARPKHDPGLHWR